jgi:hypothetical protein
MLARLYANRIVGLFRFLIPLALAVVGRAEEAERITPVKLVVEVKVAEIYVQKVRNLGFDWAQISATGGIKKRSVEDVVQSLNREPASAEGFAGFLDALAQNGLGRILAEPTLITLDGRPASLNVAETTKLDIVPIVRGDGRVHLECRLELREPHMDGDRINEAKTAAKPPIVKLDSADLLELGKTSLLSRARTTRPTAGGKATEIETLVLIRVDRAESSRIPIKSVGTTTAAENIEIKTAAAPKPTK